MVSVLRAEPVCPRLGLSGDCLEESLRAHQRAGHVCLAHSVKPLQVANGLVWSSSWLVSDKWQQFDSW